MFDETFVDGTQKSGKSLSLFVSTLIQLSVLCILLLIPLIYTATLPGVALKSLLVVPRPPVAAVKGSAPKRQTGPFLRVLTGRELVAPVAVPKQVNPINDSGAPPDVAAAGIGVEPDGSTGSPLLGSGSNVPTAPAPAPAEEPKAKPLTGPLRVGTGAAEAKLINKVIPTYPALAKAARIQGSVEFTATISRGGDIENLQLVRGHPLLVRAARDAVLQWKYRPTMLNGQPVEVLTEILVNFTLTQ